MVGQSVTESVTSHFKGREVQIVDRALGGPFGSERFSKDERFLLMMGGQSMKDLKDH